MQKNTRNPRIGLQILEKALNINQRQVSKPGKFCVGLTIAPRASFGVKMGGVDAESHEESETVENQKRHIGDPPKSTSNEMTIGKIRKWKPMEVHCDVLNHGLADFSGHS